jgi:hypothetical protein
MCFFILASMATVCNATIHKYLFVAELVSQKDHALPQWLVNFLMFFLQILWPIIGLILCLGIDVQPAMIIEENKEVGIKYVD